MLATKQEETGRELQAGKAVLVEQGEVALFM